MPMISLYNVPHQEIRWLWLIIASPSSYQPVLLFGSTLALPLSIWFQAKSTLQSPTIRLAHPTRLYITSLYKRPMPWAAPVGHLSLRLRKRWVESAKCGTIAATQLWKNRTEKLFEWLRPEKELGHSRLPKFDLNLKRPLSSQWWATSIAGLMPQEQSKSSVHFARENLNMVWSWNLLNTIVFIHDRKTLSSSYTCHPIKSISSS